MWAWMAVAWAADVAIVVDGTVEADGFTEPMRAEIAGLSGKDPSIETFYAGFDPDGAEAALQAAVDSDAKVIAAIGPLVSELVLSRERMAVPTVAALALSDQPAPPNVTRLTLENQLAEPLEQLAHLLGSERVVLAVPPFLSGLTEGVDVDAPVVVLDPASPPDADGALLVGVGAFTPEQRSTLFRTWTDAGVGTLLLGTSRLPDGAMGGYIDDGEQHPISRRVALTVVNLLDGREGRGGTVAFRRGELVLSADVLDALDVSLPFDVLADAEVRGWAERFPQISMVQAIGEAFQNSPELAAIRSRIDGENTGPMSARATLLPQVDASATWTQLDPAIASDFQPQTNVTAGVSASQVLWSDGAVTNVRVQADLQEGRDAELTAAEQDLAYDVAVTFVNLERARAVIAVRAADIDRARLSLKVAEQRTRAGDAAASEILRWQAEVANARAALVEAWTDFRSVMVELNRLCGVGVDRMFLPVQDQPETQGEIAERLSNPRALDGFAVLAADVGVDRAPELQQIDTAVTAQERLKRLTDRAYVMPTVGVQGGVDFNIYRTPSEPITIPGAGEIELVPVPPAYWSFGASASVPIFNGGQRRADQVKAGFDLAATTHQKRQLELAIRARAVIAVNQAHGAAWRANLREDAAVAAVESLQATIAAYAAGTVTQTTVTESRTNALQVELLANDARFEATSRIMDLLRAVAAMPTPEDPDAPGRIRDVLIERNDALEAP